MGKVNKKEWIWERRIRERKERREERKGGGGGGGGGWRCLMKRLTFKDRRTSHQVDGEDERLLGSDLPL